MFTEARAKALRELGPYVVNPLLKCEGDLDRAILAHPGEWKTALFLSRVHAGRGEIGGFFAPSFDLREAVGGCSRARTRPRGRRIAWPGRSGLSSRASARKFSSNS